MKNKRDCNRGITLIALVITIIVLLILAGVSLSLIAGSGGILNQATNAVIKTQNEQIEEDIELALTNLQTEYYTSSEKENNNAFEEYWKEKIRKNGIRTDQNAMINQNEEGKFIYTNENGSKFLIEITSNGKAKVVGEREKEINYEIIYHANGGNEELPEKQKVKQGNKVEVSFEPKPKKLGYTFQGWAQTENATEAEFTETGTENFIILESNITLYAVWLLDANLVDYWDLGSSLENKVTGSLNGDLTIYKGNNLKFQENSAHLESTALATQNNYTFPSQFTLLLKYKPTAIHTWTLLVGQQTNHDYNSDLTGVFIRNSLEECLLLNGTNSVGYFSVNTWLKVNEYANMALIYDGKAFKLYANHTLIKQEQSFNDKKTKLFVGGGLYSGTGEAGFLWNFANGYYKDLMIYDKAFSQQELINLSM